jgi:hypothetical protein
MHNLRIIGDYSEYLQQWLLKTANNAVNSHLNRRKNPSWFHNNIKDSYFVTFIGGMRNPSVHGERVLFGFYRLLLDDKK